LSLDSMSHFIYAAAICCANNLILMILITMYWLKINKIP